MRDEVVDAGDVRQTGPRTSGQRSQTGGAHNTRCSTQARSSGQQTNARLRTLVLLLALLLLFALLALLVVLVALLFLVLLLVSLQAGRICKTGFVGLGDREK